MLALVFLSSISTIVGFLQSELLLLNDLVHTNIDYDFCQNQEPRNVGHNNERYANGREVRDMPMVERWLKDVKRNWGVGWVAGALRMVSFKEM